MFDAATTRSEGPAVSAATVLLTAEERDRFAAWLEADAAADEMLAARLRDLPRVPGAVADERIKDCAAKRRIAAQLRSIEDATL